MCYNCGCQNPKDDMGNDQNITEKKLAEYAGKVGKSEDDFKKYLLENLKTQIDSKKFDDEYPPVKEMFENAANAWGQSVEEAKEETYKLLQYEIGK